jgi:uncharacterized protein (DUF362 family)
MYVFLIVVNYYLLLAENNNEVVIMRKTRIISPIVGVGKNPDEKIALRQALGFLPSENLISSDDVVVITCNMVNMNPPEKAVIVGPETLRELIRFFKEKSPKKIVVASGSSTTNTLNVLKSFGYDKMLKEEQVNFVDLNSGPYIDLNIEGKIVKQTKINSLLNEATIMVSFTQLQTHEEAVMSASIKNIALSWPPAEMHGYPKKNTGIHEELHDFIFSMAKNIPIDLAVVSLSPAMIGTGPSKGIAIRSDMVIASFDSVACDTIGARLLGFRAQAVGYLYRCIKEKIGIGRIEDIDLQGQKLVDMERQFSKLAYGKEFSVDE